jgi:hypothetical protein
MIMKCATQPLPQATDARTGRRGGIPLIAIMLAVGVTAFGLGGAQQVRAEPPDPCEYGRCEF